MVNAIIGVTLWGHVDGVWRFMFAVCALPAVALFFGMLRMPESPRWLVEKGRDDEALAVLKTVRSEDRAMAELASGRAHRPARRRRARHQIGIRAIMGSKWLRRIILVGIGVCMTQQLTGINSIMYYGTRVLEESGMGEEQAVLANIAFGVVAVHRRNHRAAQHGPDRPPQDLHHRSLAHHDLPLPRGCCVDAATGREPGAAVS